MNKATNDVFNVQDRVLSSWVFAKTKVNNFGAKLPAVYFTGSAADGLLFRPGATVAQCYINVHPDQATYTSALAHEYGHWFHYLTRGTAALDSGPQAKGHSFCQPGISSTILALKEGYATAFGLSALWNSKFLQTTPAGSVGTAFCFFSGTCREIEAYDCDAIPVANRDLSFDEGRVAAALRDLVDLAGDNNAGDTGRGDGAYSDALSGVSRRKILYDPLRSNPKSMKEYWTNFKAVPGLTAAQINAAYNVLKYQYAKFDK